MNALHATAHGIDADALGLGGREHVELAAVERIGDLGFFLRLGLHDVQRRTNLHCGTSGMSAVRCGPMGDSLPSPISPPMRCCSRRRMPMLRASSTFANFVLAASSRPWPAMMVPSWRTRSSHTCPNWRNDDRSCAICAALCRRVLPASWLGSRTGRACPVRDLVVDFRSGSIKP